MAIKVRGGAQGMFPQYVLLPAGEALAKHAVCKITSGKLVKVAAGARSTANQALYVTEEAATDTATVGDVATGRLIRVIPLSADIWLDIENRGQILNPGGIVEVDATAEFANPGVQTSASSKLRIIARNPDDNAWAWVAIGGTGAGAGTSANPTVFTVTSHGLLTGDVVHMPSTNTQIGAGLVGGTPYWVVKVTADTFQLSLTRALALAGTGTSASASTATTFFKPAANVDRTSGISRYFGVAMAENSV